MPDDPYDQDHPLVQEVQQVVTNHGWLIMPSDAIDLVQEVKQALASHDQKTAQSMPQNTTTVASPQPKPPIPGQSVELGDHFSKPRSSPGLVNHNRVRETEKIIRLALPDRLHSPDGVGRDIPTICTKN